MHPSESRPFHAPGPRANPQEVSGQSGPRDRCSGREPCSSRFILPCMSAGITSLAGVNATEICRTDRQRMLAFTAIRPLELHHDWNLDGPGESFILIFHAHVKWLPGEREASDIAVRQSYSADRARDRDDANTGGCSRPCRKGSGGSANSAVEILSDDFDPFLGSLAARCVQDQSCRNRHPATYNSHRLSRDDFLRERP